LSVVEVDSNLPSLSIVIPSYNQGTFIERTIKSIVDQQYPGLQLILMDGESTDETMSIVERYRDGFAVIRHEKDGGQADAIARGFELCTSEIMTWLNSDDTYLPGTLRRVGEHFRDNPEARFVYGDYELIDADDEVIAKKRQPAFDLGVVKYAFLTVPQMSAFWRRSLYLESGGIDPSLRFAMDYDLFVKLGSLSPAVHLPFPIGRFRIHTASKTTTLEDVRQQEDRLIQDRFCRHSPIRHPLRFAAAKKWFQLKLVTLLWRNRTLGERLRSRIRNGFRSLAS
jgi:glycosyltransferase involved in cell wall biosynthesis